MKKVPKLVKFDPAMWAELEKIREKTGAPVSEIVRRAVAEYLASREKRK